MTFCHNCQLSGDITALLFAISLPRPAFTLGVVIYWPSVTAHTVIRFAIVLIHSLSGIKSL